MYNVDKFCDAALFALNYCKYYIIFLSYREEPQKILNLENLESPNGMFLVQYWSVS